MYCEKCGNEYGAEDKFCIKCGSPVGQALGMKPRSSIDIKMNERWYHRLGTVVYVIAHLPLLIIVPLVWTENAERYSTYSRTYYGSDSEALWYCVLTIFIWVLVLRLIKMALKYIVSGQKPKFKDLVYF